MNNLIIFQLSSQFLDYKECLKLLILNQSFRKYEKGGWLTPST